VRRDDVEVVRVFLNVDVNNHIVLLGKVSMEQHMRAISGKYHMFFTHCVVWYSKCLTNPTCTTINFCQTWPQTSLMSSLHGNIS
jgi:hypothetical protein